MNSTKLMFTNTMMIGVIITICSNNWISMWMGLEMSLLSFIPLMQTKNKMSSESMIKYFISQSIASTTLLISVIIMLVGVNMNNEIIMTISMLIKLGSSPFHNWVIITIEMMDFWAVLVMLTILKMPPLSILYQMKSSMINLPIYMGMLVGSIMALNQSSMRKLIGYSSIFNMSVILMTINMFNVTLTYLMIYTVMIMMIIKMLKQMKISFINQMTINEHNMNMKISIWMNMLSMAGFPPLMGFIIKMMVIQLLLMNNQFILMSTMIFTSMIVMMFYTRMAFSSMMSYSTQKKWSINNSHNMKYPLFLTNMTFTPMILTLTSLT